MKNRRAMTERFHARRKKIFIPNVGFIHSYRDSKIWDSEATSGESDHVEVVPNSTKSWQENNTSSSDSTSSNSLLENLRARKIKLQKWAITHNLNSSCVPLFHEQNNLGKNES